MNVLNVYCRCGHDKIHHLSRSSCRATALPGLAAAKFGGGGVGGVGVLFVVVVFAFWGGGGGFQEFVLVCLVLLFLYG